jgi:hypothetical protein
MFKEFLFLHAWAINIQRQNNVLELSVIRIKLIIRKQPTPEHVTQSDIYIVNIFRCPVSL